MKTLIQTIVQSAIRAVETLQEKQALEFIEKASSLIALSFQNNKKILIAGNGGSLCDAMHFSEELTGQFRKKRKALPAIALADPGSMSCIANDFGYDSVFARGVEAYGQRGDVFVALTTSGNSSNLIQAVLEAKKKGLRTIGFLGKSGGKMKGMCDLEWIVEGFETSDRIQEAHMSAIHIIIEIIEKRLFYQDTMQTLRKKTPMHQG